MTGTMVEVGMNKRAADSIFELFEKKDRIYLVLPHSGGLYLVELITSMTQKLSLMR